MHSKDARAAGETEQRLYLLDAWRETSLYSERERAALEWTEALTLVAESHVPDEVYERVRAQFSENEIVHLSLAIVSRGKIMAGAGGLAIVGASGSIGAFGARNIGGIGVAGASSNESDGLCARAGLNAFEDGHH